jgi:iron transport multicopper oxidase
MKYFNPLLTSTALFASSVAAKTVTLDWNITWVTANPDGLKERPVIGINGEWPMPTVEVDKGDRLVVNVHNSLPEHNTSIHFHGMYQNGTNYMDGPPGVVQCPIIPGQDFTYNFTVNQNGTYWYHSHVGGQYPDGYRAPFIVHDKNAYFAEDYDEELTWTVSDWYHEVMDKLSADFLNLYNPSGAEPIPQNLIFNNSLNSSVAVKPNTTYLIHIMNMGALPSIFMWIEDHDFQIVEVDGVYTEPTTAEIIYITPAQRYSILLKTKETTDKNFGIVSVFDQTMFDVIPDDLQLNQTNWLEYNASAPHEHVYPDYETSEDIKAFDDFDLIPYDRQPLLPEPDQEIVLSFSMNNLLSGKNYAFFDNITYTSPKVPSLYTVMSGGDLVDNPIIYGEYTHSFVLEHMNTIQIVLNSEDPGVHPFHMHGHEFQVIYRDVAYDDDSPTAFNPDNHNPFPEIPIRRDTVFVRPNSNLVLRFRADNPGVWIFHCHIEWHLEQGLAITLVEAPAQLQKNQKIPQQHYDVCAAAGVPTAGNAAANTVNFLDLTGQNAQEPDLPAGFTARGIVALVFSCVAAFIGMGAIAWYGMSDITLHTPEIEILEEDEQFSDEIPK